MADYGYFGKGAEGYAHYSSQSTRVDTEEKMDTEPQNSADQSDVVINLLFSLGMLGLALVVWAMIYIVLS